MAVARRKDKNGEYWVDFRFSGRRIRRKSPEQCWRGAARFERTLRSALLADVEEGRDLLAGPSPTLDEFAHRWLRDHADARFKPSGRRSTRSVVDHHLIPRFGRTRLDDISAKRIDEFAAQLTRRGLSAKTINNILSTLRSLLGTAHRWGLVRRVPDVRWLPVPEPTFDYLSLNDFRRLLAAADPGALRTLVLCVAETGMRIGEACALHWEDLDLDAARLTVSRSLSDGQLMHTKTGRIRHVPLSPRLVAALRRLPRISPLVFPREAGQPRDVRNAAKVLHRVCDRAGLRRVGWHTLRHTYATLLSQAGLPTVDLSKLLGHTSVKMTMRYAHASPHQNLERWMAAAMPDSWQNGHHMVTDPSPIDPATVDAMRRSGST